MSVESSNERLIVESSVHEFLIWVVRWRYLCILVFDFFIFDRKFKSFSGGFIHKFVFLVSSSSYLGSQSTPHIHKCCFLYQWYDRWYCGYVWVLKCDLDTAEIWSEKVRLLSKMTPRLRAECCNTWENVLTTHMRVRSEDTQSQSSSRVEKLHSQ